MCITNKNAINLNKRKIFNDPVYGFITINSELIFDIVEHKYFQRLRRIKQLGLTDYVYPGALHTRFHHALGAMHLMEEALNHLKAKGHGISDNEEQAAKIAILLHDIGHGPFSHTLESTILKNISHEAISAMLMEKLNSEFNGQLELAIKIFNNQYHRPFLHQLVSSQLDIDRLDYLQRDCFFTGVSEGAIGANRIIKMLDIYEDQLVIEEKGIYSVENFLSARRLMYWQVYHHKTSIVAEQMLIKLFNRAKQLTKEGVTLNCTEELQSFLQKDYTLEELKNSTQLLNHFTALDDHDIWSAIKIWKNHSDKALSFLCQSLINRKLFRIELSDSPFEEKTHIEKTLHLSKNFDTKEDEIKPFIFEGTISNSAYIANNNNIFIKTKGGKLIDVADASDLPNIKALSKIVKKHYLCYPKTLSLYDIKV